MPNNNDLLSQCDIETFCSGGKGGQHQNKTESGVRLRHRATGLTTICRDERSQHLNKMRALESLAEKLAKRAEKPKPRIPTKKSRAIKQRILARKKMTGQKKKFRRRPGVED